MSTHLLSPRLFWKPSLTSQARLSVPPTCHDFLGSPCCSTYHTAVITEIAGFHSSVSPTALTLGHIFNPTSPRTSRELARSKCPINASGSHRACTKSYTCTHLTDPRDRTAPLVASAPPGVAIDGEQGWSAKASSQAPPSKCHSAPSGCVILGKSLNPPNTFLICLNCKMHAS